MSCNRFGFVFLVPVAALLAGCSGGAEGGKTVPVYPVKGTITLDGAALAGASVSFAPKEGQPVAVGTTNDAGEFTLTTNEPGDGAAVGRFAVTVMKLKEGAPAAKTEEGHSADPTAKSPAAGHGDGTTDDPNNLVPGQYGDATKTPLAAEVKAGSENSFKFELKK